MNRKPMVRAKAPMRQVSEKRQARLNAAGIVLTSSFAPTMRAPRKASRKPALPRAQKKTLAERSGGMCEIAMTGCTDVAVDPAHRSGTRLGGRRGKAAEEHARVSNVLHACRNCHRWTHDNPAASKAEFVGWALEEWQEPTEWPVLYRGELSYLTDLGQVIPYEEGSA